MSLEHYDLDDRLGPRALPLTLLASTFSRRDALAAVARAFDVTTAEASPSPTSCSPARAWSGSSPTRVPWTSAATGATRRWRCWASSTASCDPPRPHRMRLGWVAPDIAGRVIERHPHLDLEQADGVRELLTSGNGLDVVIGQAGTGKSTMLGAARVGWEEAGYEVIGVAVASRTAAALEACTGIPSSSLARSWPISRDRRAHHRTWSWSTRRRWWGADRLDQLRQHVDVAGAKVVLVGDNRQLSSIDAGGALRTLSRELADHVVNLTTNRRQAGVDQAWERDALVALRTGDLGPAVCAYVEHGRVTITDSIDVARPPDRGVVGRPRAVDGHLGRAPGRRGRAQRHGPGAAQAAGELGRRDHLGPRRSPSATGCSSRRTNEWEPGSAIHRQGAGAQRHLRDRGRHRHPGGRRPDQGG